MVYIFISLPAMELYTSLLTTRCVFHNLSTKLVIFGWLSGLLDPGVNKCQTHKHYVAMLLLSLQRSMKTVINDEPHTTKFNENKVVCKDGKGFDSRQQTYALTRCG